MMMASYLGTLALRVEEWLLHHAGIRTLALVLDGDLDLELRARRRMRGAQVGERDVFLQERRPAAAARIAGLLGAGVDRHASTPRRARYARGKADLGVQALERLPLDLDADEAPLRCARGFRRERLAADEALFLQIHRPGEIELIRAGGLRLDERLARRHVIDVDQHQAGFNARHIKREHAGGGHAARRAHFDQRIPDGQGVFLLHPYLVAEVAGVTGAGDSDRYCT